MTLIQPASWRPSAQAALLCVAFYSCSSVTHTTNTGGGLTAGTTGGSGTGGSTGVVHASSAVSGTVSSAVVSSSQKLRSYQRSAGNACAGQSFSVYEVGGNGTAMGSGTVNSDGSFTITWTTTLLQAGDDPAEAVLVFNCATAVTSNTKCYGKPGDSTLVCDPVSNALVAALEHALNAQVETGKVYKGLSMAKIAEGLVETLKLVSRLNPTTDYAAQLAAATTAAEITSIINASPVGSLFQSIQTLAAQAVAQNTSFSSDANSRRLALEGVWGVDKVISLLAGSGLQVAVTLDNTGDGPGLYGPLATLVDTATGTTFMQNAQLYLSNLYTQLYVDKTPSQVTFLCVAQNNSGNYQVPVVYAPDVVGSPLVVGNSNNVKQLSCMGPTAVRLKVAVSNPNSTTLAPNLRVTALISATLQETDRNDPDGTHTSNNNQGSLQVSLLDVFSEFQAAVQPGGVCEVDYNNAANNNDFTGLGNCIRVNHLDKYFSGVLGLYRFLTDPTLHDIRVSMDDVYLALVDSMSMRLTGNFNRNGSQGASIIVSDYTNGDGTPASVYLPAILFDTQPADPNNTVYQSYCPDVICTGGVANSNATSEQIKVVINASRPGFQLLFGDILHLPDMGTIKSWIFASAHHVDYNTAGSHFYPTVGKDDNGDGTADRPILCKLYQSDANQLLNDYQDGATVYCEAAQGTWAKGVELAPSNGNQIYKDYTHWFGLQTAGQVSGLPIYALVDLYTGNSLSADGQSLRLLDLSTANSTLYDNFGTQVVADGTSLYENDSYDCQTYTDSSGQYQSSCHENLFKYLAVNFPNRNASNPPSDPSTSFYAAATYYPFSWTVPINQFDPRSGSVFQQYIQIAVTSGISNWTNNNMSQAFSVCVGKSGVQVDPNNWGTVDSINLLGNVGDCRTANDPISPIGGSTFYYLQLYYSASTDPNQYAYQLIRNDGLLMQAKACQTGFCPATVLMSNVATALDANTARGMQMGPQGVVAYLPGYNMANPRYDAKFDPYCLDQDGDGHCDCFRDPNGTGVFSQHLTATSTPTDADCNLSDQVGTEPTISNPPTWDSGSWSALKALMDPKSGCGNLSAQLLQGCLIDKGIILNNIQANWAQVFSCVDPNRQISYVNTSMLTPPVGSSGPPADPNQIGGNCGPGGNSGPVVLNAVAQRNNAYDIARPQTVLKLISTATQDTGTGVTIGRSDNLFTFNQAMSLAFFRLAVPLTSLDVQQVSDGSVQDFPGLVPDFEQIHVPWQNNPEVSSAVLRAFLVKAGTISNQASNPNSAVP